jgi:hypothetical protein
MTRQRNGYGARVGASGFLLTDSAPESANVGRAPKRDGNVVLKFECASCGYWAGDVGLPIEQPEPGSYTEGTDPFNTPWYDGSRSIGELELDDGTPQGAMWAHCARCRGKSGQPRDVVLQWVKVTAALQELRRLHLKGVAKPIERWEF